MVVFDGNTNGSITVNVATLDAIAVNPVTDKIFAIDGGINYMTVIGRWSSLSTTTGEGRGKARCLAVNPVTNKIYASNYGSNSVTVVD